MIDYQALLATVVISLACFYCITVVSLAVQHLIFVHQLRKAEAARIKAVEND